MFSAEAIQQLEKLTLEQSLSKLCEIVPSGIVFSTSLGQEDQIITDVIFKNKLPIKVFTLDTGRLFYEHYDLLANNNSKYKIKTEVYFPAADEVEKMVNEKGINSFFQSVENRKECCAIRKVKPLNRALEGAKVWITGLRSEQSENRQTLQMLEWDATRQLHKFNPLLYWTYNDVLKYIEEHQILDLPLHRQGFISVGCKPCTRAIEPGENPRAGRWWWEESQKECGLHSEK
ncbi:phosphoadenylyl-sulfate reductase [Kaistella yonginensis]|uniref:phosphoadenylyl-sulfate reductase n=1 Tax=Kaistella yonginensis TaxID=658267 RepID=UPI0025B42946|nr:phosphoadenylyl-sulfate reductase [Kaistella yonginensis]MDN3605599.1 phosphoadenylyl-sulfate reductase [Kaistella yonginensis]